MRPFLILVFFLTLSSLWAGGTQEVPKPSLQGATVTFIDGDLQINGRTAAVGDPVPDGATVETGKDSTAEIQFSGKNIVGLGKGTIAVLSLGNLKRTLELKTGRAAAVLKKLDALAGGEMNLRTPTASGAVRGTTFWTQVKADGSTYFCTCNGSIELGDDAGGQKTLTRNIHHGALEFARKADGQVTLTTAGLQEHGDADLEALAARIGVAIDWTALD